MEKRPHYYDVNNNYSIQKECNSKLCKSVNGHDVFMSIKLSFEVQYKLIKLK